MAHAFASLAAEPAAPVEELALGLAAEFRPVDAEGARLGLDALASEVGAARTGARPEDDAAALALVLGDRHDFHGDRAEYDDPDSSFLDVVLERRRGLPILLSTLYVAVAARAGIPLAGVGLPGHFVVAHLAADPPLVLDPFARGGRLPVPGRIVPWSAHGTALRMLNNLVRAFQRRADLGAAIRAAELRLELPVAADEREELVVEARALRARLN